MLILCICLGPQIHGSSRLQIAAVLCITHLAWNEEEGSAERQAKLKQMGIPVLLHNFITGDDQDLFDRYYPVCMLQYVSMDHGYPVGFDIY